MTVRLDTGRPYPLGTHVDSRGTNFALFSAHAEKVELCLFDAQGRRETDRLPLPESTNGVWHGHLPESHAGLLYGYRVHGPYAPEKGHRFNPHKLLLDPYARDIVGEIHIGDGHFGYRIGAPRADLSFDRRDSARVMPKCRVIDDNFHWGDDRPPRHKLSDSVIYELHVRGFTKQHTGIPEALRGTVAALRTPEVIKHLRHLGVTAVELMPVHYAVDDRNLIERGLRNFWGYNTIGYFAPGRRALGGDENEFKRTVAALHAAQIEVILDVVYNHTAEGNELGPTLCFRGIDNLSYYWLAPEDPRRYADFTGVGNTLRLTNPRVLQLVTDSLRYWVEVMHVDGFRFDLATALARGPDGFDSRSSFLDVLAQDPVLSQIKLIAEPWDVGKGGYRLGAFPPGWSEWNDRFRDDLRRFWRGDGGVIGAVAARIAGSADIFRHDNRRPSASINFITAHDGFTLADLVGYNAKHNEANLENNGDGAPDNLSWNCGVEGPTDDVGVLALRHRQRRNFLASLLLSLGVPMLLAGDEMGNSQNGNNNAYCQDNEIGWVDWSGLWKEGTDLTTFIRRLVDLRRDRHLTRDRFLDGKPNPDDRKDMTWLRADGKEMSGDDWRVADARFLAAVFDAPHQPLMLLMNGDAEPVTFTVPETPGIKAWRMRINTATEKGFDDVMVAPSNQFVVSPRSLAALTGEEG
ncbi:MAG: glycogen debranching protein GlgX [Alphaproteobacteria bacterium]|nr:glycogen debranching protein GlgX [Alphaproteobacteria bacterium]